jgi:hypothetical protein
MPSNQRTKNDIAWEQLFKDYNILDEVKREGQFIISAAQINTIRESRLMAKFDQSVNLPQIFRHNKLSILPVSRSKYIIAPFITHREVNYSRTLKAEEFQLPLGLESIDIADLYSEAMALNCAFNAGLISQLMGEETYHTVSGRMSTERFTFSIESSLPNLSSYHVNVEKSQCEIDGGFEGGQYFALVEAKNYKVDDFLIRQLYYPYRLWSSKISKRVVPILMTFSEDTFDFFVYEFVHEKEYNSLKLIQQRKYALAPEVITTNDISIVLSQTQLVPELQNIPFPQADRFDRVMDLLSLLTVKDLTRDDITENYQFNARQTNYYTDAARYLGLLTKFNDPDTREVTFTLTNEARSLLRRSHKQKYLGIIHKILEHVVFNRTFRHAIQQGKIPSEEEVSQIIVDSQIGIGGATVGRRSRTVRGWIDWIWKQIDD